MSCFDTFFVFGCLRMWVGGVSGFFSPSMGFGPAFWRFCQSVLCVFRWPSRVLARESSLSQWELALQNSLPCDSDGDDANDVCDNDVVVCVCSFACALRIVPGVMLLMY